MRNCRRIGVDLDDRIDHRAVLIERVNAIKIPLDQMLRREFTHTHLGLQVEYGSLLHATPITTQRSQRTSKAHAVVLFLCMLRAFFRFLVSACPPNSGGMYNHSAVTMFASRMMTSGHRCLGA